MTFADAANFKMPFGKFAGLTLDSIAINDAGLAYLDWMRGQRGEQTLTRFDEALRTYLDDPSIAADVAKLARGGR